MSASNNSPEQLGFQSVDPELIQHFREPLSVRVSSLDLILTLGGEGICCFAVSAGLKYGIQSGSAVKVCPNESAKTLHRLTFIDNDYKNYDHAMHLDFVKRFHPKYATVVDIFSQAQCDQLGLTFRPLGQVLDYAEELSEHCENVIVIPKYDCLDKIPAKFMLGYSVPTSHGATPLPVQMFKGRRVHLLGGSWKNQLHYLAELKEDVVSLDNNHCNHIAQFGGFYLPDGERRDLKNYNLGHVSNPRVCALALSVGAMMYKLNQLYAGGKLE